MQKSYCHIFFPISHGWELEESQAEFAGGEKK